MESFGEKWLREVRETKKHLEELGHYFSAGLPLRCQHCRVLAGILSQAALERCPGPRRAAESPVTGKVT